MTRRRRGKAPKTPPELQYVIFPYITWPDQNHGTVAYGFRTSDGAEHRGWGTVEVARAAAEGYLAELRGAR